MIEVVTITVLRTTMVILPILITQVTVYMKVNQTLSALMKMIISITISVTMTITILIRVTISAIVILITTVTKISRHRFQHHIILLEVSPLHVTTLWATLLTAATLRAQTLHGPSQGQKNIFKKNCTQNSWTKFRLMGKRKTVNLRNCYLC